MEESPPIRRCRFPRRRAALLHADLQPITEQHEILSQKLRGHYAYYGITGNRVALSRFREEVRRVWRKWLVRRRGGNRRPWNWFIRLQERYHLPYAVAIHSICRKRSEGVT